MDRKITYTFLFAFLLGCVFAELTADPVSDMLFFKRAATGTPFTADESVVYWYYLPAIVYTGLLALLVVAWKTHKIHARHFAYALVFLAAWGTYNSFQALTGLSMMGMVLLAVPVVMLAYVLFKKGIHG